MEKTDFLAVSAMGLIQNLVGRPWATGSTVTQGAKKKKGNIVTGNTKCSLRNRSVSTVEKLFDLLTHFIGIGKTT